MTLCKCEKNKIGQGFNTVDLTTRNAQQSLMYIVELEKPYSDISSHIIKFVSSMQIFIIRYLEFNDEIQRILRIPKGKINSLNLCPFLRFSHWRDGQLWSIDMVYRLLRSFSYKFIFFLNFTVLHYHLFVCRLKNCLCIHGWFEIHL